MAKNNQAKNEGRERAEKLWKTLQSGPLSDMGMSWFDDDVIPIIQTAFAARDEGLVAAARPFAEAAQKLRDNLPDSHEIAYGITYGHIRALAALVEGVGK